MNKIHFFSDQPLDADREQDVRFGHRGIMNNLKEIILQCPLPFTIGLFGRWGSGKTTIINVLRKKLLDSKMAVVKFDVWKHEQDSFRRAFLEELVKQAKNNGYLASNFKLSQRLKNPVQKTKKGSFTWNRNAVIFVIGIIAVAIVAGIILYRINPKWFGAYSSILLSGSLITSLFIWAVQQTLSTETIIETAEPFKDPHEFEEEFEKIIDKISSEKVLIIIDNLDRCTHKKAVELLSTIKTFLAKDVVVIKQNKCAFLIACDDEAIKRHLESVYLNSSNVNKVPNEFFCADEFLRKFFNTFLRIPIFINTELQTYTEELLKETNVSQFDTTDVAYVISSVFRENPRQIKQFINILLAHFLLARERESGQNPLIIPKGTITGNVAFLAKFLIIRQKFSLEYREIIKRHLTLKEMEDIKNPEFKDFLRATKTVVVPDIRPFIYLKQSEEERTIPDIQELELGLIDDKRDAVKEKLKSIKTSPEQVESLKRVIPGLIDRNATRKIPLLNIVSCSLDALRHHNLEMGQEFYDKIADLLNNDQALKLELQHFEPSLIFTEVLTRCNEEDRDGILAQFINILNERKDDGKKSGASIDYAYSLIQKLLEHKDWLKNKKREIRQGLTELYSSTPKILSLFKNRVEDQKEFIAEETISKFVITFSNEDVENMQSINEKVDILLSFKEIIDSGMIVNIISSLQNLLKNENSKPYRNVKENFFACIEKVVAGLQSQITDIPNKIILNPFADTLTQGINAVGAWDQRKIFVFTGLKMADVLENSHKPNMAALMQEFFVNANVDSVKFVFDKYDSAEEKESLINKYLVVFQQKAMNQQPLFDLLYPLACQEVRIKWMAALISTYPQRALEKLEKLDFKVDDKKNVVETMLETAKNAAVQQKTLLYNAANKMKCANDSTLRNNFGAQIKILLKSTDINQQQVGHSAFQDATHLSESLRRDISRETIEWLRTLQPANAGQLHSVKSIIPDWKILESPVQKDYIDFVFDKLIKRGVNIDSLRLGFEILFEIKPKYEEHSTYFDDIYGIIESGGGNEKIKNELISGLAKLKPQKPNQKDKDFWNKVTAKSEE